MSDDDFQICGGAAFGRHLSSGLPDNHLAFVDAHLAASEERVQHARMYWPERSPRGVSPVRRDRQQGGRRRHRRGAHSCPARSVTSGKA
jgi:hypothetical protein